MKIRAKQFNKTIKQFTDNKNVDQRYASYDYCFSYFGAFQDKEKIADVKNIRQSCMELGIYLASWGMFRGSSKLLAASAHSFVPLIKWISECDQGLWTIDVPKDDDPGQRELLLNAYAAIGKELEKATKNPSKTLITKVMLGVFGNIPAFDTNFCKTFHMATVNDRNLLTLHRFYEDNKDHIQAANISCFNFNTGNQSGPAYTKAKIIDMYGFAGGIE